MEFDETNIEFVQADTEMVLEILAENFHDDTSPASAHQDIAERLWPHVRALEYRTGRMLAVGADVDLLAGGSPGGPRPADTIDDYVEGKVLTARMPATGRTTGCTSQPRATTR